jgi:hypothetical protein
MPPRIKLPGIVIAIDLPNRDWKSYVNRQSGAIVTVTASHTSDGRSRLRAAPRP